MRQELEGRRRLTQEQVLRAAGISGDPSKVSHWYAGRSAPDDPETWAKLADAHGLSLDYVIRGERGDAERSPSRLESLDSREFLAVAIFRSFVLAVSDTLAKADPEGIGIEAGRDKPGEVLTEILRLANLVSPSGDEDKQG